jgi:hypothetical protein
VAAPGAPQKPVRLPVNQCCLNIDEGLIELNAQS